MEIQESLELATVAIHRAGLILHELFYQPVKCSMKMNGTSN
jgi:hypothetical protein